MKKETRRRPKGGPPYDRYCTICKAKGGWHWDCDWVYLVEEPSKTIEFLGLTFPEGISPEVGERIAQAVKQIANVDIAHGGVIVEDIGYPLDKMHFIFRDSYPRMTITKICDDGRRYIQSPGGDLVQEVTEQIDRQIYGPKFCQKCNKVQPVIVYELEGSRRLAGEGNTLVVSFQGNKICRQCHSEITE